MSDLMVALRCMAEIVGDFGPAIALFGALYAIHLKSQNDFRMNVREERRQLFLEFSSAVSRCIELTVSRQFGHKLTREFSKLADLMVQLQFTASPFVCEVAEQLLKEIVAHSELVESEPGTNSEDFVQKIASRRAALVGSMINDLQWSWLGPRYLAKQHSKFLRSK